MMDLAGFDRVYARRAVLGDYNSVEDAVRFACKAAVSRANTSATAAGRLPLGGRVPSVGGVSVDIAVATAATLNRKTAYARLAQATQTTAGWYLANTLGVSKALNLRIAAGRPAAKARLVTPLSSAVVLETKEQYQKAGLDDDEDKPDKGNKPKLDNISATPEPGSLLLFGLGLTAAAAGVWHRRKKTS